MKFLADQWSEIKKWWSVWVGLFATVALTAVPIIADQWPQLAPGFIALFPKGGEQWAPVIGLLLTIAARLVSQAASIDDPDGAWGLYLRTWRPGKPRPDSWPANHSVARLEVIR